MLTVLMDTCVWFDMAKDYRHGPTLQALEQMIEAKEVALMLPKQTIDEFARNRERIVSDSGRSLSSTFKRVKEAIRQFGREDGKNDTLGRASMMLIIASSSWAKPSARTWGESKRCLPSRNQERRMLFWCAPRRVPSRKQRPSIRARTASAMPF